MENRKKGAKANISVTTSYPVTIPGLTDLYQKTYRNLLLRDALALAESKIRVGYRVTLYFSGDEEIFFDIPIDRWQK